MTCCAWWCRGDVSTAVNPSINHALGSGVDHFVVLCQQSLEKRIARGWIFFGNGARVKVHKEAWGGLLEFCLQYVPSTGQNAVGCVIVRVIVQRTPPDV